MGTGGWARVFRRDLTRQSFVRFAKEAKKTGAAGRAAGGSVNIWRRGRDSRTPFVRLLFQ
jgi:hypothetical protein